VIANLMKNVATAKEVLRRVIPSVPVSCAQGCTDALKSAIITDSKAFTPKIRRRLDFLLGRYFPAPKRGPRRRG
jgi:hypothetical protein